VIKTSQYCDNELMRALKEVAIAGRELVIRIYHWRIESQMRHAL